MGPQMLYAQVRDPMTRTQIAKLLLLEKQKEGKKQLFCAYNNICQLL